MSSVAATPATRSRPSARPAPSPANSWAHARPSVTKKDPRDKHRLIIDEPAAEIVRRIFDMRCQGYGYRAIVNEFNGEGILPPKESYYNEIGQENPLKGNGLWTNTVVMRLTRNEACLGHMVQFKTGSISFKNHKLVDKPEDEWIRAENTHEPIIGKEQWDMVQQIAVSKRKPRKMSDGGTNMYVGLLRCADCGSPMRAQLRRYTPVSPNELMRPAVFTPPTSPCGGFPTKFVLKMVCQS